MNVGKKWTASGRVGADSKQVGKKSSPTVGKPIVSQEPFEEQTPTLFGRILQVLLDFLFARDPTNQVDAQFSKILQIIQKRTRNQILLVRIVLFQAKVEF